MSDIQDNSGPDDYADFPISELIYRNKFSKLSEIGVQRVIDALIIEGVYTTKDGRSVSLSGETPVNTYSDEPDLFEIHTESLSIGIEELKKRFDKIIELSETLADDGLEEFLDMDTVDAFGYDEEEDKESLLETVVFLIDQIYKNQNAYQLYYLFISLKVEHSACLKTVENLMDGNPILLSEAKLVTERTLNELYIAASDLYSICEPFIDMFGGDIFDIES